MQEAGSGKDRPRGGVTLWSRKIKCHVQNKKGKLSTVATIAVNKAAEALYLSKYSACEN